MQAMLTVRLGIHVQDSIARLQELGVGAGEGVHTRPVAIEHLDLIVGDVELPQRHWNSPGNVDLAEEVVREVQDCQLGAETGKVDGYVLDLVVGEVQSREALRHLLPVTVCFPLDGEVGIAYIQPVIQTGLPNLVNGDHIISVIGSLGDHLLKRAH